MAKLSTIRAPYWHVLSLLLPQNLWKLWEIADKLGGPREILGSETAALQEAGLSPRLAARIAAGRDRLDPAEEWRKLETQGIGALALGDPDYPARLAQIHSAPPIIYVRGRKEVLGREGLAVVGSRKLSSYGRQAVESLVPPLVGLDISIISGMALGADSAALEACLESGGGPVAVLASSLSWEEIAPRTQMELARAIADAGCLVSENPPGTVVNKGHFPLRNRIISGLSAGVLVIEAARRSGSAVTARLALEQDREVFAVPGSIFAPNSEGALELIKQGAKCVTSASDIACELNWDLAAAKESRLAAAGPMHGAIRDMLRLEPAPADRIIRTMGRPAHEVMALLTELEMAGALRRSGNGVYHNVT
jgi:DNA processing protein